MKKLFLFSLVFVLILASGCAGTAKAPVSPSNAASVSAPASGTPSAAVSGLQTAATSQKISPQDVKKMMDSGAAFTLVDVRTAEEYNTAHIAGALNIPVETIGSKWPAQLPDLSASVVVYCRTGVRSAAAAKALAAMGYTKVSDMGGIESWPYGTVASSASAASSSAAPAAASAPASASGILSAFTATDLSGRFVTADVWKGAKLTMVNVWATFCGPCINEMPELGKLSASYKDKDVQIVGIIADSSDPSGVPIADAVALAKEIVTKTGANYEHILASTDLNKKLLNKVSAVPTTIFVDAQGNQVGTAYVGSRSGADWAKIIDTLLKEVK